ncbi:hypothetical protein LCGC14_2411300 [marine sediment metagenome]|uniref:Uncharacterized protein n=1 Tax=marine sediment metagenome TaxID=412755 RepID=A0A0F9BSI4_9ZZZZ
MSIDTTKEELRVGAAKSLGLYVEVTANANATNSNTKFTAPDLLDKARLARVVAVYPAHTRKSIDICLSLLIP